MFLVGIQYDTIIVITNQTNANRVFTQCTMQLGNLNTDSRNSMQNQELSFIWSPFYLLHLKHCALDKGFKIINTQILCLCHKKKLCNFPALLFHFQKWVFTQ